jgi:hypothetical protein
MWVATWNGTVPWAGSKWDEKPEKYRKEIGVGLVYSITILNNLNSNCGLLFVSYIIIFCSALLVFGFKC